MYDEVEVEKLEVLAGEISNYLKQKAKEKT